MRVAVDPNGKARFKWTGTVSNGATWSDTFDLYDNGNVQISGANTSTWKILVKQCGTTVLTLTSGTEITVTQNTTKTSFEIDCPQSSINSFVGEYDVDLAEETSGGTIRHWCNGTFTFIDEELGF